MLAGIAAIEGGAGVEERVALRYVVCDPSDIETRQQPLSLLLLDAGPSNDRLQ